MGLLPLSGSLYLTLLYNSLYIPPLLFCSHRHSPPLICSACCIYACLLGGANICTIEEEGICRLYTAEHILWRRLYIAHICNI